MTTYTYAWYIVGGPVYRLLQAARFSPFLADTAVCCGLTSLEQGGTLDVEGRGGCFFFKCIRTTGAAAVVAVVVVAVPATAAAVVAVVIVVVIQQLSMLTVVIRRPSALTLAGFEPRFCMQPLRRNGWKKKGLLVKATIDRPDQSDHSHCTSNSVKTLQPQAFRAPFFLSRRRSFCPHDRSTRAFRPF